VKVPKVEELEGTERQEKGLMEKEPYFHDLGYRGFGGGRVGVSTRNSRDCELPRRTCGSIILQIPVGIKRVDPAQGHIE
jgi:hypothetical protein